jgi:hypothetical protein
MYYPTCGQRQADAIDLTHPVAALELTAASREERAPAQCSFSVVAMR